MSEQDVFKLYDCALVLDARDKLFKLNSADYPNMKDHDRKKLHKEIHEVAYPVDSKNGMTTDQVANELASILRGV